MTPSDQIAHSLSLLSGLLLIMKVSRVGIPTGHRLIELWGINEQPAGLPYHNTAKAKAKL
jgi:hypothetical protein